MRVTAKSEKNLARDRIGRIAMENIRNDTYANTKVFHENQTEINKRTKKIENKSHQ